MRSDPLVSAIIPTYNRADLVGEAVESVLAQTYSNVEVIVVDDGSSDDTCERLRRFGNAITVLKQQNAGPAAARNRGISASHGEYVAFLDSDDLWLPNKLERQVALMGRLGDATPCCLSNIMMQWKDRHISAFEIAWLDPANDEGCWLNADEVLASRFVLFNQGVMIRRSVLEKIGGFDESLRLLEDGDLALRLSLEGSWGYIREPLVIWRETKGSCSQQTHAQGLGEKELLVRVLEGHLARVERLVPRRRAVAQVVRRELAGARRQVHAVALQHKSFPGASLAGKALSQIERYRAAILRRSRLFPRMKVDASAGYESDRQRNEQAQQVELRSC